VAHGQNAGWQRTHKCFILTNVCNNRTSSVSIGVCICSNLNSSLIMVALCNRADHYILPCDFYLLSSSLWPPYIFSSCGFFFFFSKPNLSGRRLDVYHTSTHGVALVQIYNTGLKRAARGLLKIQHTKKSSKSRHMGTIPQICRAMSSQLRHVSTIGKNLLSSNISSTCLRNMVNFGPLAAEIC